MSVLKLKDNQGNITPILTIKGEKGDPCVAIGQIVESVLPLTDAGLHLLDGAKLPATGMYAEFYQHCQSIQASYPSLFVSESDWQSTYSTYGSCGKFVLDSDGVRLPSISNIVQGTSDVAQLGALVGAGLPNITGKFISAGNVYAGAFVSHGASSSKTSGAGWGEATWHEMGFDASRVSSIYGNSSTVQPQTIRVLLYICVANNTKSDVIVDIDRVATDLNGKLDRDLSNVIGDPVDRLVEYRNAGNNHSFRFSSGLQIERGSFTIPDVSSRALTYLMPFTGEAFPNIAFGDTTNSTQYISAVGQGGTGFWVNCSSNAYPVRINYLAIGRWK